MDALAVKGRDNREVGQAYRGTPGKYAKHTEGLKAFIMRQGKKKKAEDLLPSQKSVCSPSKLPFQVLCNIHAAQEKKANELIGFRPLLKTVCRNSCVQFLFVCLFI